MTLCQNKLLCFKLLSLSYHIALEHELKNHTKTKIGQPNQCGTTLITSVSFKCKLAFYIQNVAEKKLPKKSKSQDS